MYVALRRSFLVSSFLGVVVAALAWQILCIYSQAADVEKRGSTDFTRNLFTSLQAIVGMREENGNAEVSKEPQTALFPALQQNYLFDFLQSFPQRLAGGLFGLLGSFFRGATSSNSNAAPAMSIEKQLQYQQPGNGQFDQMLFDSYLPPSLTKIKVQPIDPYDLDEILYGEQFNETLKSAFLENAADFQDMNSTSSVSLNSNNTYTSNNATIINNSSSFFVPKLPPRTDFPLFLDKSIAANLTYDDNGGLNRDANRVVAVSPLPFIFQPPPGTAGYFTTANETFSRRINNLTFAQILNYTHNILYGGINTGYTKYLPYEIFSNTSEGRYDAVVNALLNNDAFEKQLLPNNTYGYFVVNRTFAFFGNGRDGYFPVYPYGFFPNGTYGFFPELIPIANATGGRFTNAMYFNFPNGSMAFYLPYAQRRRTGLPGGSVDSPIPTPPPSEEGAPTLPGEGRIHFGKLDPIFEKLTHIANLSNIVQFVKSVTPPIGSTPGINQVTDAARKVVPPLERDGIVESLEEKEDLDKQVQDIIQYAIKATDRAVDGAKRYSAASQRIDPLIRDYNDIAEWKKNISFFTYDEFREVGLDYARLYLSVAQNATAARDEIYAALLRKQRSFYDIPAEPINTLRQNLQYAMDRKYGSLVPLFVPVTDFLTTWRDKVDTFRLFALMKIAATQICALNPQCCDHPVVCPPNYAFG